MSVSRKSLQLATLATRSSLSPPAEYGGRTVVTEQRARTISEYGNRLITPGLVEARSLIQKEDWYDDARRSTEQFRRFGSSLPLVWVVTEGNDIPDSAIPFGKDRNGHPMYIARALVEGSLHIGKASHQLNGAVIGYAGVEHTVANYEVLVCASQLRWGFPALDSDSLVTHSGTVALGQKQRLLKRQASRSRLHDVEMDLSNIEVARERNPQAVAYHLKISGIPRYIRDDVDVAITTDKTITTDDRIFAVDRTPGDSTTIADKPIVADIPVAIENIVPTDRPILAEQTIPVIRPFAAENIPAETAPVDKHITIAIPTTGDGTVTGNIPITTDRPIIVDTTVAASVGKTIAAAHGAISTDKTITADREADLRRLAEVKTVILIDDSLSMQQDNLWELAGKALAGIVDIANQYGSNGCDIHFIYDKDYAPNMVSRTEVVSLFNQILPRGQDTPTGAKLGQIIDHYLPLLEHEHSTREPITIVVITDGLPTDGDELEKVIVDAANRLDHLNISHDMFRIQFVQIGTDPAASELLRRLDDHLVTRYKIRDIVDSTPYDPTQGTFDTEYVLRILLGGLHKDPSRTGLNGLNGSNGLNGLSGGLPVDSTRSYDRSMLSGRLPVNGTTTTAIPRGTVSTGALTTKGRLTTY